jgi:hypothetical protein
VSPAFCRYCRCPSILTPKGNNRFFIGFVTCSVGQQEVPEGKGRQLNYRYLVMAVHSTVPVSLVYNSYEMSHRIVASWRERGWRWCVGAGHNFNVFESQVSPQHFEAVAVEGCHMKSTPGIFESMAEIQNIQCT